MQHDNDNNPSARPAAFDARLTAHIPTIRRYAHHFVPHDDVEELVNDTVLNAIERWGAYREDANAFSTWLVWQMRSVMTKRRHRERMHAKYGSDVDIDDVLATLTSPAQQEDALYLGEVTRRLKRSRGGRMLLRHAKGELMHEIGKKRGVSGSRVQQLIECAREKIGKLEAA